MKQSMKVVVVVVLAVLAAGSAFAANSLQSGSKSISVGMGDSIFSDTAVPQVGFMFNNIVTINGKINFSKGLAMIAGFGVQQDGGDANSMYIGLNAGVRKYLKTDDMAPFVEGKLAYANVSSKAGAVDLVKESFLDLSVLLGVECFLAKQLSLEGSMGLGFGQIAADKVKDSYFGTRTTGVRANFYF